jgi:hypothetical protein
MAEQTCERDDSHSVHGEDHSWVEAGSFNGNTHWHEDQQDVDPAVADSILGVVVEPTCPIAHAGDKAGFLRFFFLCGPCCGSRVLDWDSHLIIFQGGRRLRGGIDFGDLARGRG